jgi:hypothetical protein
MTIYIYMLCCSPAVVVSIGGSSMFETLPWKDKDFSLYTTPVTSGLNCIYLLKYFQMMWYKIKLFNSIMILISCHVIHFSFIYTYL